MKGNLPDTDPSHSAGSPGAVAVVFTAAGLAMASAVSRIPQIADRVHATPSHLAFALVCIGIGSIVAMPFAGRLVQQFSTRAVCRVAAVLALAGWSAVPLAHSVPELAGILLVTGAGVGVWDVSMNVQGTLVEQHTSRVFMPLWHGLFSVGAVVGALVGAAAARAGMDIGVQLPALAAVLLIVTLIGCGRFLPDAGLHGPGEPTSRAAAGVGRPAGEPAQPSAVSAQADRTPDAVMQEASLQRRVIRQIPITRVELLLGLITLATALGEGAANDWLALALVDSRGAPAAIGALTYAGFNLTMAIGRFAGGPLIARHGRVAALRAGGLVACGGVLVLCLVPGTVAALIGAAGWGLGLAVVFPSAMSAAGEVPGRGGRAVATVSTIGYGGFLFGAPLIGFLAHLMPLLHALLTVAAFALLITLLAPAARERRRPVKVVASGG